MKPLKEIRTLADLTPDPKNCRLHSARGIGMLEDGLNALGAGRSILIDADGEIIAGNGVVEAAALAGIERVRVIESDGHEIIAVRRADLTGERKLKMALLDNRAGELSEFDPDIVAQLAEDFPSVRRNWTDHEWAELLSKAAADLTVGDGDGAAAVETCPTCNRPLKGKKPT